jgi:TonB family protein
MDTSLLALYIKLNVLIAAALLLWLLTKNLARIAGFEINHARQLHVARMLFIGVLAAATVAVAGYAWLSGIAAQFSDGFIVVAGLDDSLARDYEFGAAEFELQNLLLALLCAGFAWQAARLVVQVRKLRALIGNATELRSIGGTHLLVSTQINTPFSTRALGRKHIVLPMSLLESPRNLRLAVKHELQHVRNGDLEWVIMLEAVKTLCFWNPAVWLWHNEFDCLQEFACDEALIDKRHVTPQAYGTCLLEVASANSGNALFAASNMIPKFSLLHDAHSQLKRRITMLTITRNNRHHTLKSLCYGIIAGAGLLQTAFVVFAAEAGNGPDVVPLLRINPDYPAQALADGQDGWVQLKFDIEATGAVSNPAVVDSCQRTTAEAAGACAPSSNFEASALAAIAQWRYEPKMENGTAVKREGVQTIIRYTLTDD